MIPGTPILLSTAYLPPVQYISKFLSGGPVFIEKCENFQKQSYRNRCYIYGANGRQCLVIPVIKNHGEKKAITDVQIDYAMPWQKNHLKSIQSAYRTSPFYEFYADDFNKLFNESQALLLGWNMIFLRYILEKLDVSTDIHFSATYESTPVCDNDLRQCIHPKTRLNRPDNQFHAVPYSQVFSQRFGFMANLSIIDLLFNEGPEAKHLLSQCIA